MARRFSRLRKAVKKPFRYASKRRQAANARYLSNFLRLIEDRESILQANRDIIERAAVDGIVFSKVDFYGNQNRTSVFLVGKVVKPFGVEGSKRLVEVYMADIGAKNPQARPVSLIHADRERVRVFDPFSTPWSIPLSPKMAIEGMNYLHSLPLFLDEAMAQARETGAKSIQFQTKSSSISRHLIKREGFKPMQGKKGWLEKRLE